MKWIHTNDKNEFNKWFLFCLVNGTESCFEREVLRRSQDRLWEMWQEQTQEGGGGQQD